MSNDTINDIIARKQAEKSATPILIHSKDESQEDKFYSVLLGEGMQENFMEIRTRDGLRTCFPYSDIMWIVYDPEAALCVEFNGYLVQIEGRGLVPKLFDSIKQKRVAWVKEADTEMQDHKDNSVFISNIVITPPKGFSGEDQTTSE